MPSQMSTVDNDQSLEVLRHELAEARRRETATAEILQLIRSSRSNAQRVFEAIARNAVLLCNGIWGGVFYFDGTVSHFSAGYGLSDETLRHLRNEYPIAPRGVIRLAITNRTLVHVVDALNDPRVVNVELVRVLGYRSQIIVPMMQGGEVIGTLHVFGAQPKPFADAQIALLQTFADQAVIAIENTRLFEAEQARTAELKESLEYQTATADVLNVISRSPNDLQPVLNAIIATAGRLCEADYAHCRFWRDGRYHVMARHALNPDEVESVPGMPVAADRSSVTGKAVTECRTIHVPDVLADPEDTYAVNVGVPARTILGVPHVRNGKAIGVIVLFRRTVRPFTQRQIELVTTFANQAVIAIENTRLFEEVQARNRALAEANTQLTETVEQQTATSRILRVISRSPTDVQPVFETTVESAARLCDADRALIYRFDGEFLRLAASYNASPVLREFIERNPIPPGRQSTSGRAALERQTVHILDVQADAEYAYGARRVDPIRSTLAVPMLKGDGLLG